MKYLPLILAGILLTFGGEIMIAYAAQDYIPLVSVPGVTEAGQGVNLSTYLVGGMKFLVAGAGALAVIMVIIAGTQYVASGISPDARSSANERMVNALTGLALVLVSYLILNTINPNLVNFKLEITPVAGPSTAAITTEVPPGGAWPDDSTWRNTLINHTSSGAKAININHPNCATEGVTTPACTSVYQLGDTAMNGLIHLADGCNVNGGCIVMINGGTEYWFHSQGTAHRPGGNVVDLSKNSNTLNNYISTTGTLFTGSGCSVGTKYKLGADLYVDEQIPGNPPHWHVCYGYF